MFVAVVRSCLPTWTHLYCDDDDYYYHYYHYCYHDNNLDDDIALLAKVLRDKSQKSPWAISKAVLFKSQPPGNYPCTNGTSRLSGASQPQKTRYSTSSRHWFEAQSPPPHGLGFRV